MTAARGTRKAEARPGKGRRRDRPAKRRGRPGALIAAAVVLAGAVVAAFLLSGGLGGKAPSAQPAGAPAAAAGLEALKGRWLRLDGGYILELRAIDAAGKVDAAYLNPQPINVARAEATMDGSRPVVFVELRAPNYPGSTYTLTYDPQGDKLAGVYFQAVQQQRYDVEFVRMK